MRLAVLFSAIFLAVFAMAISGGFANAQQATVSLTAANGAENGAVDLSWDAFPGVTNYTVGWLAVEDYEANRENNEWLKYFAYSNVGATQTCTVRRLTPGIDYWLIACESLNDVAPGAVPQCTGWERLTVAAGAACPTIPEGPMPQVAGDYDADDDGLIEIRTPAQLDAIRADPDGDSRNLISTYADAYAAAFPDAIPNMGCPASGCIGFELAANLDLDTNGNGYTDEGDAYWNDGDGWTPIGRSRNSTPFTGTFDGGGFTIANLYIDYTDRVGLFREIGAGGEIKNVGLTSASVTGRSNVGGLVGANDMGQISDSYVSGSVSGVKSVGGLAGSNDGRITDSHFDGDVTGTGDHVGGLVGWNDNAGRISGSHATGRVKGDSNVGGLVGYGRGAIAGSYADSQVSGARTLGGLVGDTDGLAITGSYSTGSVTGSLVGGLVGELWGSDIKGSYSTAAVMSSSSAGGLVGEVSSSNSQQSEITSSYASGSEDDAGKTTAELQSPTGNTGIYADWDQEVWDFGTSEQYPVLKVEGLSVEAQRQ